MMNQTKKFLENFLKKELPDLRPGDTVRVHQKIKDYHPSPVSSRTKGTDTSEKKEKTQAFEGLIIAIKHGRQMGATITVRKVISGIGVEKIFPLHSPTIEKIEVLRRDKARRAKLYYLRRAKGKRARLKKREFAEAISEEQSPEEELEPVMETIQEEK